MSGCQKKNSIKENLVENNKNIGTFRSAAFELPRLRREPMAAGGTCMCSLGEQARARWLTSNNHTCTGTREGTKLLCPTYSTRQLLCIKLALKRIRCIDAESQSCHLLMPMTSWKRHSHTNTRTHKQVLCTIVTLAAFFPNDKLHAVVIRNAEVEILLALTNDSFGRLDVTHPQNLQVK